MKINQSFLNKVISQPLEKIIVTALAKLKSIWAQESVQTGIQFYGNLDE